MKQVMTNLVPPVRQKRNRDEGDVKQCDRHS